MFVRGKSNSVGVDPSINVQQIAVPKMPKAGPKDKQEEYVVTLKSDSPYDYLTIAGVSFMKKCYPTAAAELGNQNIRFDSHLQTLMLTEAQVKYIKDRAKKIIRNNVRWGTEVIEEVCYADLIILETLESVINGDPAKKARKNLAKLNLK